MTEKLLQYIWRFQYFSRQTLTTDSGESIEILFPGQLNSNQGPDFLDARIRIGKTTLAGSVELHLKTSDWQKHDHEADRNYKNVALHVVYRHDENTNGIPVLELQPRISSLLLSRYETLMQSPSFVACSSSITHVRSVTWFSWKERLLAERLTRKAKDVLRCLEQNSNHWEETFWQLLARTFGGPVNKDAFEAIARSLPLSLLAKHRNNLLQIEAFLFGQANLLGNSFTEDYPKSLQREYQFLRHKYNLQPVAYPVHFLRMRPGNFPTIRLAQLAILLHTATHLFSKILEADTVASVKEWLHVTASEYWHYHYRFGEQSAYLTKKTGDVLLHHLLINAVIPVLFAYGLFHGREEIKQKALQWLEAIPAESNSITNGFTQLSVSNQTAFDSQALIELKNEFCNQKRCLECSVGNSLLKQA